MSEAIGKNILAIVHYDAIGRTLERIFERSGCAIEVIESAVDASEEVRDRLGELLADVVITDWSGVNGAGIVKVAQEKGVKTIIIMDGGLMKDEEREKFRKSGAADIVPKPFDVEKLIDLVKRDKIEEALQTDNSES